MVCALPAALLSIGGMELIDALGADLTIRTITPWGGRSCATST